LQSRLKPSEMRHALAAKLLEELLDATDPDEVKAEFADLLEVIRALADLRGQHGARWKPRLATNGEVVADSARALCRSGQHGSWQIVRSQGT
jgi:hypothetical protein